MPRLDLDWYLISRRSALALVVTVLLLVGAGTTAYLYLTRANEPPVPTGDKQIARFLSLEGSVKVKRGSANYFIAVNRATPLETGDTVQTDADGHAQIKFVDGSTYSLGPDSTMVIRLHLLDTQDKFSTQVVAVGHGQVKVKTSDQDASINKVETISATADIKSSTNATVAASRNGKTEIDVQQGVADVTTQGGQKAQVGADERLQVDSSGSILSHEKMLPSPRLIEPYDSLPIPMRGDKMKIVLGWSPINGAQRYHVVVSTSRYFTQVVKEVADVRAPTLSLEDMPAGRYFWQVKAIDGKGRASSFSDPFQFILVSQNPQAARSLDIFLDEVNHLGGLHYEIKGRAGAGAQVKINGKMANVDGDGRFRALITLSGDRMIVVEAEDQSGSRGRLARRV